MASIANITVKNAANADVIYVAKVGSAGDNSPAQWRCDAASAVSGNRPQFSLTTRSNAGRTVRHMRHSLVFPIIETIGGVETVVGTVRWSGDLTILQNVSDAKVEDAVTQGGNLLVSTLFRASAKDGYAPT